MDLKINSNVTQTPPKNSWGKPNSFCWGKSSPSCANVTENSAFNEPVDLRQVMSEQLVDDLKEKEENFAAKMFEGNPANDEPFFIPELDTSNDEVLAQLLQIDFDREADRQTKIEEKKYNGDEKVSISMKNYLRSPIENSESSSEDEDEREFRHKKAEVKSTKLPTFGPSGLLRQQDGSLISKHDTEISAKRNAKRVMEFPPEFLTGDSCDLKISNRVFNKLKLHSMSEERRQNRLHEKKDKSTAEFAVDGTTRLILFKMVNSGLFEQITGSISTGKEAVVFHAYGGSSPEIKTTVPVPGECAIKVFKTVLCEFKNRIDYVTDDYRFKNPRKILKVWAEKEMMNLNRMRRAGISCPDVVKLRKHVLVMSFIGSEGQPAPKLKDSPLVENQLQTAYDQCCEAMHQMYKECRLVHADLSEFNVLWWQEKCHVIDVSQSVDTSHPNALPYLARDCLNISEFFMKRGLATKSVSDLFNSITGLQIEGNGSEFVSKVQIFSQENRSAELRFDRTNPANYAMKNANVVESS